ncbi:hypothetical protein [cf. Phormidesmis sp. LEGE 11477]|uniref:hypothetical protein n=1 Tax=cf. Phormidesmis sp. LEGE 11477 TaxID=1828680 RepID=UPI00187E6BBF|nr:hypothetical protein [cf. Phormidesmis sp. LEGE 11477]MBE9062002.1 hypothetical protein [cf. Phormidesmis sp. LEGE 11477]
MDSEALARYIEATDGMGKPWLLIQLRLAKLKERRHTLSVEAFNSQLAELHEELMKIGEWWVGQEKDVF